MPSIREDGEIDRLVGALSKRIAQQTGRNQVKVILDLLYAADLAGLNGEQRLEVFRNRLSARERYCEAEGLDFATYAGQQLDREVDHTVSRIRRAMQEI